MNLLDLMVKIGVDDQASPKIGGIASGITGKLGQAAKVVGTAIAGATVAAGAGAVAIGKAALDSYASYEQMVGGVDKLFGDASGKLQQYAAQAYQTSGMSANQYMEQATSFSAALINSLGGDTARAADMADVAMRAMSDNVNVFGSNAEDVQNAIMGISRQNYTMIDNLKLGYAGTKQGMEQLIADANAWGAANGEASDLSIDSFADCVQAIQQVQEAQGIAGTTAKEAAGTIEGSVTMAKAAWENWLTALGDEDADLSGLTDQLIASIETVASNVVPRLGIIAGRMMAALPDVIGRVVNEIPVVFGQFIGPILDDISARFNEAFGTNIDLSAGIGEMFSRLQTTMQGPLEAIGLAFDNISAAIGPFVEQWGPMLAALFTDVIAPAIGYAIAIIGEVIALLLMFGTAAGEAIQAAIEWFQQLPENVGNAINAVVEWFQSLPDNVVQAFQKLKDGASKKIGDLISYVKKLPSNIKSAIGNLASIMQQKGRDIIDGIKNGVVNRWDNLRAWLAGIPSRVRSSIGSVAGTLAQKGRDIISGLKSGLTGAWGSVRGWVSGIPTRIKNALGGVGSLLSSAGRSIINGLKSGMVSAFTNVKKWVSGIAGTIRSLKGPLDYDKTVLIDNGEALMYGLQKGLSTSFEGKVKPYVKSMAGEMSDAFNVPSVSVGGTARSKYGPSLTVTIGSMTVRNRDDAEYMAQRISDIWSREIGGTL